MSVRKYFSNDTGAPQLTGGDTLITVLQKCLVDGYGTRVAAGWSFPFSATHYGVFKQGGGREHYFKLRVNLSGGSIPASPVMRAYESMSDIDTGENLWGTQTEFGDAFGIALFGSSGTPSGPWIVVADERTCHLFVDLASSDEWSWCCFGEYISKFGVALRGNVILGSDGNPFYQADAIGTAFEATNPPGRALDRSPEDAEWNKRCTYHGFPAHHGVNWSEGRAPFPHPILRSTEVTRLTLTEGGKPYQIGWVRGIWPICQPPNGLSHRQEISGRLGGSDRTLTTIKNANATGAVLVETSDTWDIGVRVIIAGPYSPTVTPPSGTGGGDGGAGEIDGGGGAPTPGHAGDLLVTSLG